jgi:hypothetical protein
MIFIKRRCKYVALTVCYSADLDNVTLETKSNVAQQTIADFLISNNNEIRPTGKATFEKNIFCVWAPIASTVVSLKVPPMQFYLW